MTKTDFAELKEKLTKFDVMALSAEYIECCKRRQYNGLVRIEDMVKWQHSKDSAIISELIEIIKLQNIEVESYVRYIYCTETCHLSTRWSDHAKCTCGAEKLKNSVKSSLSETTTRLQKLREGK